MTPEKAIYLTLKDFFEKTKELIKSEKMTNVILDSENFPTCPFFNLIYTKPASTAEHPDIWMREYKSLIYLFTQQNIEFKYEQQIMEIFLNRNINDKISIHSKSSWKRFINDNFHNCADLIEEFQKEEIESFTNKLDKKLKPKSEPVKKMKI